MRNPAKEHFFQKPQPFLNKKHWISAEARRKNVVNLVVEHLDRTKNISLLYTNALRHLYIKVAIGDSKESTGRSLYLATMAIKTNFLFAYRKASFVKFAPPSGEEFSISYNEKFNPSLRTGVFDYIQAFYLFILSNDVGIDGISEIDIQRLTYLQGSPNAFYRSYANFLKSMVTQDGLAGDWLERTFDQSRTAFGIPDDIDEMDVQYLEVWRTLLSGKNDEFNNALGAALDKHHTHKRTNRPFSEGSVNPGNDEIRLWSLPLTAICKMAHKNGMSIRLKSPYIPEVLVYDI